MRTIILALFVASIPIAALGQEQVTKDQYEDLQKNFADAYNRKDVDAMANAFTDDAIRVTPSGMFVGRDAIKRNLQEVVALGLHDYTGIDLNSCRMACRTALLLRKLESQNR